MTILANWLPNPVCCNTEKPGDLCPECKIAFDEAHPPAASYVGANALVVNDFDEDNFLPLPVLEWNEQRQAPQTETEKKNGGVAEVPPEKKTQLEIDEEEEERVAEENRRRLSRLSTNLDQDDVLPLPVLNWQESPESINECNDCIGGKLELPQPAF